MPRFPPKRLLTNLFSVSELPCPHPFIFVNLIGETLYSIVVYTFIKNFLGIFSYVKSLFFLWTFYLCLLPFCLLVDWSSSYWFVRVLYIKELNPLYVTYCKYSYWSVFFFYINLFIYFWLHWVFIAAHRLSLVAASGGYSSLQCAGFSLWWLLLLQSTGSRCTGFSSCGMWAQ